MATVASTVRTSSEAQIWKVIFASAIGTMIEWYDFYILAASPL